MASTAQWRSGLGREQPVEQALDRALAPHQLQMVGRDEPLLDKALAHRDQAVVIRTQKLGEADRIVTLFSREHGRIRAVAKGVRRTKSKFGARLEPGSYVDIQLYTGKTFDVVTQVESLENFGDAISHDYQKWTIASAILEAAERFT